MKNSAWYHKLWRKKLDNYPLKGDADSSWAEMKGLLDGHLPVDSAINNKSAKSIGGTIVSILGFILPAAAMIGAITYVAVKHPFKNNENNKHHYHLAPEKLKGVGLSDSTGKTIDTSKTGTSVSYHKGDTTVANTTKAGDANQAAVRPTAANVLSALPAIHNANNYTIRNTGANKNANRSSSAIETASQKTQQQPPGPGSDSLIPIGIVNDKANRDSAGTIKNDASTTSIQTAINNAVSNTPGRQTKLLAGNAAGSKITPVVKAKPAGSNKIRSPRQPAGPSPFDFNISAAINAGKGGANAVIGVGAGYTLNPKWLLNAGFKADINRPLSGTFNHPSYARPDTSFAINDTRKLNVITVPVTLEYNIIDILSINAGPQLSFSTRQSKLNTKLGTVANYRDTLSHTHTIDSALTTNRINKITVGISAGISIKLNRFYIDGTFQQNLTPYNVTTGLGGYKQHYGSFQVGVRYKFKKKSR